MRQNSSTIPQQIVQPEQQYYYSTGLQTIAIVSKNPTILQKNTSTSHSNETSVTALSVHCTVSTPQLVCRTVAVHVVPRSLSASADGLICRLPNSLPSFLLHA